MALKGSAKRFLKSMAPKMALPGARETDASDDWSDVFDSEEFAKPVASRACALRLRRKIIFSCISQIDALHLIPLHCKD